MRCVNGDVLSFVERQSVTALECDPSRFICSGECPPLPEGVDPPTTEAICSKDPESDTCICWLHNPSSQLHSFFQCEARINGSDSSLPASPKRLFARSQSGVPDRAALPMSPLRAKVPVSEAKRSLAGG
ncbi:uncharacterized protein CEXT_456311 [Caerostris extrusa]|uniref:Thyroglobulin type-1 domain-containing protein n=1 Tax=Caerostris extrusa TaxID=172846 RepID=A0AAV4NAU0_CAEEX|nr:uncharacterized protein CEXT_456311 [Caerostris extrusa]